MRLLLTLLLWMVAASAKLNVAAAYPSIGELVRTVGGERVEVVVLAAAGNDPHFITPKPSLIARVRAADLLIANGAQLEIGWLPALIDRANNAAVRPGQAGYLELSGLVTLLEKPQELSRAQGDVHPAGNPHFMLDPHNLPVLAEAIAGRLSELDAANAPAYAANLADFKTRWQKNLDRWDARMLGAKGRKVAQYHGVFTYFLHRYGIESIATLEPLPGIPPSARHLAAVIERMKNEEAGLILQDVYHDDRAAKRVAEKTGAFVAVLPHEPATSLEALFETLTQAFAP